MANNNKNSTTQFISNAMQAGSAMPHDEVTPNDGVSIVSSKEELLALVQDSDVSYVDYKAGTTTFTLGIISAPTDTVSPVYYFRHERSLPMPDTMKAEIKAAIPNAEFIDQGANRKRKDNDNITEHFHNPSYSPADIHAEVKNVVIAQQQQAQAPEIPVQTSMPIYKTAGLFGLFSSKPSVTAVKTAALSNNSMDEVPGKEADNTPKNK